MKRREFITLVGGAAAWPLVARSQQLPMRRIGILLSGTENDPEMRARVNALRQGLRALGWSEGGDYRFEYRWPESDPERVKNHAAQLIELAPDVIVAGSQLGVMTLLQETRSIPIVFVTSPTQLETA
jgi:putative ABC transport system substrate-binding protein